MTLLTFRTSSPAVLQRRIPTYDGGTTWQTVCNGGCRIVADPRFAYRVAGDGVVETDGFLVEGQRMVLDARPASKSTLIVGAVGVVGGAALAGLGLELYVIGSAGTTTRNGRDEPLSDTEKKNLKTGGVALFGVGLVVGGIGLALAIPNWKTKVTINEDPSAARLRVQLPGGLALGPGGLEF